MIRYNSFRGTVTMIEDFMTGQNQADEGCYKFISVEDQSGSPVNFVVSPSTYVVDQEMLRVGDVVTGYYDADAPVILIYPPQYPALVMVKESPYRFVKLDYFNSQLVSSDNQLKLNLSPNTEIVLTNGQAFNRNPANRNLIVIYGASTKSIPAQTTPDKIIVLC